MNNIEQLKEYKHIVFGAEHYNPLGIVRSLGEYGIKPIGIIIKSERKITSKSKYFSKIYFVNSIEEGYILLKDKFGSETKKPFVYASDDSVTSYFDERYSEIKDKFYFYNACGDGIITKYMNKSVICGLAKECGIPIAPSWTVKKGEIPKDIEYPIITKAITSIVSNWKDDVFICHNEEDLKEAYKNIRSENLLLQKYIYKKNELCLDGISYNDGKDVEITIASKYNYIIEDTYSYFMSVDNFYDKEIYENIKKMFRKVKFNGIFSLEFLIGEKDEYYFLEINFRNSTWSYASTCSGNSLPIMWANATIGNKIETKKIEKPFNAIVEFDDYRCRVKTKKLGKLLWLKDVVGSKCKFCFNIKDMNPFFSIIFSKVRRKLNEK